jgi:hypothetical protein
MKKLAIISTLILSISACSNSEGLVAKNAEKNTKEVLPTLISSSHEFEVYAPENDSLYLNNHKDYIADYLSVNYSEQVINVQTLFRVHCNDSLKGQIKVSNDTIYLSKEIIMRNGRPCPEYHTFQFQIRNPSNKKYTFVSEK